MEQAETSITPNSDSPNFIFPPDEKYECIKCGLCCSDFWEIPVDQESAQRLLSYDLGQIRSSFKYYEPLTHSILNPERLVIKQINNRCSFLIKQYLCGLHLYFGYESKPKVCRQFPFIFVKTPGGIYVSTSFACRSVQRNEGPALVEQEPFVHKIYAEAATQTILPTTISLDGKITLTWQNYLLIETGLLELLSIETLPLTTLLIAGNIYLDLLVEFIKEASQTQQYTQDEIIESYLAIMQKQRFSKPRELAQRAVHSPLLQKLYVGMFISFRNILTKKRGRLGTMAYLFWQYIINVLGLGAYQLLPVENRFTAKDFATVRFNTEEPFFRATLLRYIQQLIFRKQGLDKMPLIKAYRVILLYFALIRWYAVALASNLDPPEVNRDIILQAIGLVERYYVRHTAMDYFFIRFPQLDIVLDNFMNKKHYAPSIVLNPIKE